MTHPIRQAGRTAARSFDFRGRSSRSETIGYLVLSQLPVVVAGIATAWVEDAWLARAIMVGVLLAVTMPLFALTVRRFRDFVRSGWWSTPLLVLVARTLVLEVIGLAAGWNVRAAIEAAISHVDWLLILPAAAGFLAMVAWPSATVPRPKETTGAEGSAPVA